MEKVLVLQFNKTNGKNYRFTVNFPADAVSGADVATLANVMIQKKVIAFKDNSELKDLEKAYYQEVTQQEVSIG